MIVDYNSVKQQVAAAINEMIQGDSKLKLKILHELIDEMNVVRPPVTHQRGPTRYKDLMPVQQIELQEVGKAGLEYFNGERWAEACTATGFIGSVAYRIL